MGAVMRPALGARRLDEKQKGPPRAERPFCASSDRTVARHTILCRAISMSQGGLRFSSSVTLPTMPGATDERP